MDIVIFTGGNLRPGKFVQNTLASCDKVIAADSGAKTAVDFQMSPTAVIGDLDSLDPATKKVLEQKGCDFVIYDAKKDETDTELALRYAIKNNATQISILGGTEGDRLDHILTNILSVININIPVKFVNGSMMAWVEKGPKTAKITGRQADLLSLIPLTPTVTQILTSNLRYPLYRETLLMGRGRGISNVLTQKNAEVTFSRGALLFVHYSAAD